MTNPNELDLSSLDKGMTGSCLCKAITVRLNQEGLFSNRVGHICHCANCRKYTGTIGLNSLATSKANVEVQDPKQLKKIYVDSDTTSGNGIERHFCSNCSSPVLMTIPRYPEVATVPLGIFPTAPAPMAELFTSHKLNWLPVVDGAKQFELMPTENIVSK